MAKAALQHGALPWIGVLPILATATAIEAAGRAGMLNIAIVPLPSQVLERVASIIVGGEVLAPFLDTSYLLFTSYFIASALAILLGAAIGRSRFAFNLFEPLLELIRPLPKPALLPPLMLFLGIGDAMKIVIVGLAVFFPVLINTIQGVQGVDAVQINTGRTFRLDHFRIMWKVILPAALPFIFTGLRVGLGLALIVVVIAEMLAGTGGLGYLVIDMQRTFRVVDMYAWLVILALFGYALNGLFVVIERRSLHWHRAITG